MRPRFLLDEHIDPDVKDALKALDPTIDVLCIGDEGAPPLHSLDPDILIYLEQSQRSLVTNNRRSMPGHVADHAAAGRHHWGLIKVGQPLDIGTLRDMLYLIWFASEAEELINGERWIPF